MGIDDPRKGRVRESRRGKKGGASKECQGLEGGAKGLMGQKH